MPSRVLTAVESIFTALHGFHGHLDTNFDGASGSHRRRWHMRRFGPCDHRYLITCCGRPAHHALDVFDPRTTVLFLDSL